MVYYQKLVQAAKQAKQAKLKSEQPDNITYGTTDSIVSPTRDSSPEKGFNLPHLYQHNMTRQINGRIDTGIDTYRYIL